MKIRTGFRDGHYWMEEYTPEMEKLNMPYQEISPEVWHDYKIHMEECRKWQYILCEYDNTQYALEHPEKV